MKYLLDTCCVSDFVKGDMNTLSKLKQHSPSDFAISSITILEIEYGLLINKQRAKKIRKPLEDFISCVATLAFTQQTAMHAAEIRALLKSKGKPIGGYDILIGSTALEKELTLITSNIKEFNRIPGLTLENWR
ncbi:MAG: type II toxin-antitoxin system VapC family toxin [Coxiellaceae bacterium]|nr:type II toxin-antitoxin system VapC family toxin [Coxiellaceae bacterium]